MLKQLYKPRKRLLYLTEATVTIIPFLLEQLGSRVLDKLSKGIVKDDPGKLPDAQRENLLNKTHDEKGRKQIIGCRKRCGDHYGH